jgi:uncharacterized protein (TIGR00369 family)
MVYILSMEQFTDDNFCFVCGRQNPHGLQLSFFYNEETGEAICQTSFPKHFQGWANVLHGGLISTVLDETMIKAAGFKGFKCVTVELTVRFKKKALLDRTFTITGKITAIHQRLIEAQGSITDSDNALIATATGKFMTVG